MNLYISAAHAKQLLKDMKISLKENGNMQEDSNKIETVKLSEKYNSIINLHLDDFRKIQLELFKLGGTPDHYLVYREALCQNEITRNEYNVLMECQVRLQETIERLQTKDEDEDVQYVNNPIVSMIVCIGGLWILYWMVKWLVNL
jgi:hypothetical protein